MKRGSGAARRRPRGQEVALDGDVLGMLEQLQRVADEMDRLESLRTEAREEQQVVEASLQKAEGELAERQEKAHALDIERRKRELGVKAEKERSQRVKSRLGEVKTGREYQAVLAEISASKHSITEQEEALAREQEEWERLTGEVEQIKTRIAGIREDLGTAEGKLAGVLQETEAAIEGHKAAEQKILGELPKDVVARYRLIRSRRGGLAVVQARDEACTACYMRLPPQLYIEVMRRSRLIQCPNCLRILIPPVVGEQAVGQE